MPPTPNDAIEIVLRPVGFVRSEVKGPVAPAGDDHLPLTERIQKAREYRRGMRAVICELWIDPDLDGILDGITEFSHIQILYWPHLLPPERRKWIKVHPMGRQDLPLTGIFATRSPARPNPILLSTVRLLAREGNVLRVQGLEAADGSPIVDIKPYSAIRPEAENATFPAWMEQINREMSDDG